MGGGGKFIEFGFKLCNIFKDMITLGYSNDTYRKALMVIKGGYPINIVSARNEGYIFNSSTIKLMDELFNSFISYRVIDKFFILLPLPLANIFILPLRVFNKLVFIKQTIFRKLLINGKFFNMKCFKKEKKDKITKKVNKKVIKKSEKQEK